MISNVWCVILLKKNLGLSFSIQVAMVTSTLIILLIFILFRKYFRKWNIWFYLQTLATAIYSGPLGCILFGSGTIQINTNGCFLFICLKVHPPRICRKTSQDVSVLDSELQTVLLYHPLSFSKTPESHRCTKHWLSFKPSGLNVNKWVILML